MKKDMKQIAVRLFASALLLVSFHSFAYQIPQGTTRSSDTTVIVDQLGNPIGDSAAVDAAGRQRVSSTVGVFEDKRTYGTGAGLAWNESVVGVGASVSFLPNESSVLMTLGTAPGSKITRESRYLAYVPGKGALIKMTGVFGAGVANVAKRIGYFNDANGVYFQQSGTTMQVCMRTSTSGSPVSECFSQADWNIDKLNGKGTSNITLDVTKTQLMVIDFLWQGVGRVRYGFDINGKIYYVHEVLNANIKPVVYIGSPSLPARYEIENVGTSAGATLKQICVSIDSEGGYNPPGLEFAVSNGITTRAVTTRAPVLAIRLANTFNGLPNRKTVRILHIGGRATTNDSYCTLEHIHGVTATAGGAWVSADNESGVEVNYGITSITADDFHIVDSNYVISGQGSFSSSFSETLEFLSGHSIIFQNIESTQSQMFAMYCTSFASTSNVSVELNFQVFD